MESQIDIRIVPGLRSVSLFSQPADLTHNSFGGACHPLPVMVTHSVACPGQMGQTANLV